MAILCSSLHLIIKVQMRCLVMYNLQLVATVALYSWQGNICITSKIMNYIDFILQFLYDYNKCQIIKCIPIGYRSQVIFVLYIMIVVQYVIISQVHTGMCVKIYRYKTMQKTWLLLERKYLNCYCHIFSCFDFILKYKSFFLNQGIK